MKGYTGNTFKKLGLGLIQLSLLASTIAVGINSSAYSKSLSCLKSNTCSYNSSLNEQSSLGVYTAILSNLSLKKSYKELDKTDQGFCSVTLKGHFSRFSGVSPPTV